MILKYHLAVLDFSREFNLQIRTTDNKTDYFRYAFIYDGSDMMAQVKLYLSFITIHLPLHTFYTDGLRNKKVFSVNQKFWLRIELQRSSLGLQRQSNPDLKKRER